MSNGLIREDGFNSMTDRGGAAPSFLFGDRASKHRALALNNRPSSNSNLRILNNLTLLLGFGSPGILKRDIAVSSPGLLVYPVCSINLFV